MRPFGFMAWLLLLLLAPAHARAAPAARQAHFSVEKGRSEWTLRYTFSDESNHGRKVSVALPSAAVAKDNDTRLQFPKAAALRAQVAAVRRYAATHRGPG